METRQKLAIAGADKCQRLHLLQMAAEKLCNAYLYAGGSAVTRTHAVVEKYLPRIFLNLSGLQELSGTQLKQIKRLSREIELLAPACDAAGSRPDNTEYPWQDALGKAQAPCDYSFPELEEHDRAMAPLLRSMRVAAERLLP